MVVSAVGAVGGGLGTAVWDGPGVPSFWAGGVLASVSRTSMMNRTVWPGGVLLSTWGIGVSKSIVVGALGVVVSLGGFLNLAPLGEEEEGWEEDGNVVRVNRDDHRSDMLSEPSSLGLIQVPGGANRDLLRVVDGFLDEVEVLIVVIWEDVGWDPVNCPLYTGWHLGKRKPGVIPDGEGLVQAAGVSIEVWGVGLCWSVGISAGKSDCTSVIDFGYKVFRQEAVRLGEGGGTDVGQGSSDALCEGVLGGVCSSSEEAPRR